MIKFYQGNLFDSINSDEDVVVAHVCNDIGKWGAGFVLAVNKFSLLPKKNYLKWFNDKEINGVEFSRGNVDFVQCNKNVVVANMIAMNGIAGFGNPYPLDYDSLEKCLQVLNNYAKEKRIIMPKIGSGLARGNWNKIYNILKNVFCEREKDVEVWIL